MSITESGIEFGELERVAHAHEMIQNLYPDVMVIEWDALTLETYHKSDLSQPIDTDCRVQVEGLGQKGHFEAVFDLGDRPDLDEITRTAILGRAAVNAEGIKDAAIIVEQPDRSLKYSRILMRILCS